MIVIRLNDYKRPFTVDTIFINVDGTFYTVDQTIYNDSEGLVVRFIPRKFVSQCKMILRNELTNVIEEHILNMINENGIAILTFDTEIKDAASYEMTVNDMSGNLLFRGKAFATLQTDLEQYTMNPRINNKIII